MVQLPSHSSLLSPVPFSLSVNLFKTQGSQLILSYGFSSSFKLFLLFPPVLYFLCFRGVQSSPFFCYSKVQSIHLFAKQLLPVSKHWVCCFLKCNVLLLAPLIILLFLWTALIRLLAYINAIFVCGGEGCLPFAAQYCNHGFNNTRARGCTVCEWLQMGKMEAGGRGEPIRTEGWSDSHLVIRKEKMIEVVKETWLIYYVPLTLQCWL